jgi:Family of unknown function (DUF6134)
MVRAFGLVAGFPLSASSMSRVACRIWLLVATGVLLASTNGAAAPAGDAGEYTFTVLMDGNPVGRHRIAFHRDGDRVEMHEVTDIVVRFAMIPIYRFERDGREVWEDGSAVQIDGTTNDNGDEFDISVRRHGDGYTRIVNGQVEKFDDSKKVFSFWDKDIVNHENFFSVIDDKILKVSSEFIGREEIIVAGQKLETEHYRMTGDEERDLWFDDAGRIAKVQFRRLGSTIAYVRDQVAPLPPEDGCPEEC